MGDPLGSLAGPLTAGGALGRRPVGAPSGGGHDLDASPTQEGPDGPLSGQLGAAGAGSNYAERMARLTRRIGGSDVAAQERRLDRPTTRQQGGGDAGPSGEDVAAEFAHFEPIHVTRHVDDDEPDEIEVQRVYLLELTRYLALGAMAVGALSAVWLTTRLTSAELTADLLDAGSVRSVERGRRWWTSIATAASALVAAWATVAALWTRRMGVDARRYVPWTVLSTTVAVLAAAAVALDPSRPVTGAATLPVGAWAAAAAVWLAGSSAQEFGVPVRGVRRWSVLLASIPILAWSGRLLIPVEPDIPVQIAVALGAVQAMVWALATVLAASVTATLEEAARVTRRAHADE